MKELSDILQAYTPGSVAALATVVRVEGSAYRRPGARLLIHGDGSNVGGISGGCLERDVIQRAGAVITSGVPMLVRYDTSRDSEGGTGYSLGCGGAIDVLIEPLNTPAGAALIAWLTASQSNPITMATVISRSHLAQRMAIDHTGAAYGSLDHQEIIRQARAIHRTQNLRIEGFDVFFERLHPPLHLLIFGGGNDAVPLVGFARGLGWKVTVVDVGSSPMNLDRTPDVRCRLEEVSQQVTVNESCAAVVMTHNFKHDSYLVKWLSAQPLRYLGLLGPRHRTDQMLGDSPLPGLHSPVGLDLGADNPQEVALAIVAEITAVMHGRAGGLLSEKEGPIHGQSGADFDEHGRVVSARIPGAARSGSVLENEEPACPVAAL